MWPAELCKLSQVQQQQQHLRPQQAVQQQQQAELARPDGEALVEGRLGISSTDITCSDSDALKEAAMAASVELAAGTFGKQGRGRKPGGGAAQAA